MTDRAATPDGYSWHDIDGVAPRHLEVLVAGPLDGFPFVFHGGTPSGAAPFGLLVDAASAKGMRTIMYSRPGYGRSQPAPGRNVAGAVADTTTVLEALGVTDFVTAGWSGGGPHALACAGMTNCRGAAVIAGVAPHDADDLDWADGMGVENLVEFDLARQGGEEFDSFLEAMRQGMTAVTDAKAVAAALGDLVTKKDTDAMLNYGIGEYMIAGLKQGMLESPAGWRDDDFAFITPWGLDPASIAKPVAIWHGTEDRMVPVSHGRWLAAHIGGAKLTIAEGEGHISVLPGALPAIMDFLAEAAGL
jgi:pimeloyl-ACP methyl ester carboxylesterase